ncbi:MAG: Gfo/Idh/MocA family oxidoreductase [Spirochaetaceae bacterium]|jgi:predicted dehydrogenase|nr:Gfo/Idh/MocA family oxidoreductase [Spirochaetaceae bacterium]
MNKLRIGIVGTGYTIGIAKSHIKAYQGLEEAEITAFYDIVPGRAEQFVKENNISYGTVCASLQELFDKTDALSICVPNNRHFDVARAAVDAGKHFICEKPLSSSYAEGKKLVDCLRGHTNKLVSMVGFNYRDIPAIRYMKSLIDEGKIGRVYSCVQQLGGSRIADPVKVKREWRMDKEQSGAGALPDFGSHMLDLADYLLAEENGKIEKVQGFKNTFITNRPAIEGTGFMPVTNDDCAVFNALTGKGSLCSFYACRIGMPFQTLQITGEGGILYFNSREDKKLGVQFKDKKGGYAGPLEFRDIPGEFFGRGGHRGLVIDFIDAIKNGGTAGRDIDRGLYIQYLLDKINEAAESGQVVTV